MLAIIGGTGLTELANLTITHRHDATTPLGNASCGVIQGTLDGSPMLFLPRHGVTHSIPPHRINYRANLWALQQAGATRIVSLNAVGAIDPFLKPGSLMLPDQLIDYTSGRDATFFDGDFKPLEHIEFSQPYDETLRHALCLASEQAGIGLEEGGTYACTQGPRLETAAEIARIAMEGCRVVGMTGMPEASLARELAIPYACLALVVNPAAGVVDETIPMDRIQAALSLAAQRAERVIVSLSQQAL
ncbi:S-methyl-5'-thioinosine phosphorylase [Litchfieldella xinjiangensis]|uniref:S-methyl-5'-thioinosine phosphorylase n=1 Tax=Litchfieldella xinjiangensis TaxID=1166948 RepID=UPI0005BC86E5|nr:S-methyl-5'-thioinosine phosphorylase [Halomonas xinjiangensis]